MGNVFLVWQYSVIFMLPFLIASDIGRVRLLLLFCQKVASAE